MASINLPETLAAMTPVLEHALQIDPECYSGLIDTDLQLRMGPCGITSKAIQIYLREQYSIDSHLLINTKVPDDLEHVVLALNETMIDPTHGQFMDLIGLSHVVAKNFNLKHLYPTPTIATFALSDSITFADAYADHLAAAAQEMPESARHPTEENLRELCRAIWNIDSYTPFTPTAPHFERITRRLASHLLATA
jgi:hypothetical protein